MAQEGHACGCGDEDCSAEAESSCCSGHDGEDSCCDGDNKEEGSCCSGH
jgi:hypothetical protein